MRVSSSAVFLFVVLLLSSPILCLSGDSATLPFDAPTIVPVSDTTQSVLFSDNAHADAPVGRATGIRSDDCAHFTGPCSRTLGGFDQPRSTYPASTHASSPCSHSQAAHGERGERGVVGGSVTAEGVVRGLHERITLSCRLYATRPRVLGGELGETKLRRGSDYNARAGECCGCGVNFSRSALCRGSSLIPRRYRVLDPCDRDSEALHVLLGLPETALQSPLRGMDSSLVEFMRGHFLGPVGGESPPERNSDGDEDVKLQEARGGSWLPRGLRAIDAVRPFLDRLCSYPWYHPAALVWVFAVRTITIRFPIDQRADDPGALVDGRERSRFRGKQGQGTARLSRAALLSEASLKRLRIVSYPPVSVELEELTPFRQLISPTLDNETLQRKNRLKCDISFVLHARAYLRRLQELEQYSERGHSWKGKVQGNGYVDEGEDQEYSGHAEVGGEGLLKQLFAWREGGHVSGGLIRLISQLLRRLFGLAERHSGRSSFTYSEETDDFTEKRDNGNSPIPNVDGGNGYPKPSPQVMYELRSFLSQLYEELGPYQPLSQPWLPEWVQQLLGRRVLSVEKYIEEDNRDQESHFNASPTEKRHATTTTANPLQFRDFYFTWKASLPATRMTCLALDVVPSAGGRGDTTPSLPIYLEEFLVFDWFWLKLCLMLMGLRMLQVRMVNSRLLRILFSAVYGSFILIILCLLYFMKELQALSIGKIGVVVILAMGGVAALAEGVLSAVSYVLSNPTMLSTGMFSFLPLGFRELLGGLPAGVAWGIAALFAGTLSSLLMNLFFSDSLLRAGARWGMYGLVILNFLLLFAQNREATFVILLLRYGGPYTYALWCCLVRALRYERKAKLNTPEKSLPLAAYREVPFARPMTAESGRYLAWRTENQRRNIRRVQHGVDTTYDIQGNTKLRFSAYDGRTSLYEEDGAAHTRRALEELAMQVRANPDKYTQRLRDPNTVYRWAGVGVEDSESDN